MALVLLVRRMVCDKMVFYVLVWYGVPCPVTLPSTFLCYAHTQHLIRGTHNRAMQSWPKKVRKKRDRSATISRDRRPPASQPVNSGE